MIQFQVRTIANNVLVIISLNNVDPYRQCHNFNSNCAACGSNTAHNNYLLGNHSTSRNKVGQSSKVNGMVITAIVHAGYKQLL